jgi:hypothetical protein
MATTEDSITEQAFREWRGWVEAAGGISALDPQALRRGRLDVLKELGPDQSRQYFHFTRQPNERSVGLYDDDRQDPKDFPWAYPEHPEFRKYWGRSSQDPDLLDNQPEVRRSVEIAPQKVTPLIQDVSRPIEDAGFVSRMPDVSNVQDELDSSIQSALQELRKTPPRSFVDMARQSFLEDEDEDVEPVSSSQADMLTKFLQEAQRQKLQESPAFQQRLQALQSILQTNPGFLSRQLQQVTSANVEQTEPKFTNILEEIETDPVEALQQTATPTDFVRTFEEVDGGGFDEDGEDSFTSTSTTSLGDVFGGLFGEEDSEPAFGDFTGSQMAEGQQTVSGIAFDSEPSLSLFGGDPIDTPQEAAAKGKLAEAARFVDVELAVPLALAAEKSNLLAPETIATQIGKEVVAGVIMGANPSLAAPLGGIPFVTPAGLIVGGVFAGVNAAADIANSSYSGFGFGNFMSAFFNSLTFGIFGDSVEDQENEQEAFDLLAEDIFSSGQKGEYNLGNLVPPTTSEKDILNIIEGGRRFAFYNEKELDIDPGGPTATGAMSTEAMAHSFGDPFGTGYDDTSEDGPGGGGSGSDSADAATDSDASGDSW